jgi:hypothetical protein
MGTDTRDLFVRLTHYLTQDLILGLEFDRESKGLSSSPRERRDYFGVDLTSFGFKNLEVKTGLRYERAKNSGFISGDTLENGIFHIQLTRDF